MTQAFQISFIFFEQGSGWGRARDGSSIARVTWCQSACSTIWSTRQLHASYHHSRETSPFLKPGPAGSQIASATAEVTCCCETHQRTTQVATASLGWVVFFQRCKQAAQAMQAWLRHSHQALKNSYFKMRAELSLGQVPLTTIYAPFFRCTSTFPHAFMASPQCLPPFSLAHDSSTPFLSPALTTTTTVCVSWTQSHSSSKKPGRPLERQQQNALFCPSWVEGRSCCSLGICLSQDLQQEPPSHQQTVLRPAAAGLGNHLLLFQLGPTIKQGFLAPSPHSLEYPVTWGF